ncbi:MAG: OmpA family protein [Gammaproteobacteria bacterium]|nr:OmpA family protein [Gammaproteobacteria bacterium]MDH5802607.1 OmpA family protein [Gammaproteobacteria bacterium]
MRNRNVVRWLILALAGSVNVACVSQSSYDEAVAAHEATKEEKMELSKKRGALEANNLFLQNRLNDLEKEFERLGLELNQKTNTLSVKNQELAKKSEMLGAKNAELDNARKELESASANLAAINKELAEKQAVLNKTQDELRKASEYIKKTHNLYDSLVGELKNELESKQVKIKQMKDGIDVNMSEEILFPSGSAKLNPSGDAVIKKISERLKDKTFQILVTGFTDNIPIRGKLANRYPTNWELAGARAASVVRLLIASGVPKEQLVAVSYAENQPVATNETDEGRAQNRRIELRLRPLQ